MSLDSRSEGILDKLLDILSGQRLCRSLLESVANAAAGNILVLVVYLVVKEGHDQTACSTSGSALLSLITANGIVRVKRTLARLVDTSENSSNVVREEAFVVEDMAESLCAGGDAHWLVVLISVHLDDCVESLGESVAIGGETNDTEDDLAALVLGTLTTDAEELRFVASVDVVAGGGTRITCKDGEV